MRPWAQIAFNRNGATVAELLLNTAMSRCREAVEWSYKYVKQQFTTVDFSRMLKVLKATIALLYKMGVLLWNLKVCLHGGGQVGIYFQCQPPSMQSYLAPLAD